MKQKRPRVWKPWNLEHVGDHSAPTQDVDAAIAVILSDQCLTSGWGLLLAASLSDKK